MSGAGEEDGEEEAAEARWRAVAMEGARGVTEGLVKYRSDRVKLVRVSRGGRANMMYETSEWSGVKSAARP